jgi:hypothetical protein
MNAKDRRTAALETRFGRAYNASDPWPLIRASAIEGTASLSESDHAFIKFDPDDVRAVDWWTAEPCGNGPVDFDRGIRFGRGALKYERDSGTLVVPHVMTAIILKGRFGPVEQGFIHAVASAARAGVLN